MKAFEEIGTRRFLKFIIFSLVSSFYHLLIDHVFNLPPFRKYFLILLGAKVGKDSILMSVKFINWHYGGPGVLKIGNECFIGDETLIDLYDQVILEDQVTIAQRVTLLTHLNVGYSNHPLQKFFPKSSKPVILKRGAVIAASATVLPG